MNIRQYTHKDYSKLLELIRAVYNEKIYKKAVQRFQWQYEQNPNHTSKDPLIFVLEDDAKIIGMIGAYDQKVRIGDSVYPAYWLVDFMVHPDYRRGFNGLKLARKMATQPYLMMGFPAEYTVKIWFRVGLVQFCQLVEYEKKTRRLGHFLKPFEGLIDSLFHPTPAKIKVIEVGDFDERFDRLWEKVSQDYPATQLRNSNFLNWRFFKCPHLSYRVLAATQENEVLGYIVIRDDHLEGIHEGRIVDLFTDRSHPIVGTSLLDKGISDLNNIGCEVIKMIVSSDDKVLNDTLCQNSFVLTEKKERGVFINNTNNGLNSIVKESSNWYLTMADSDMDLW